MPRSLLGRRCCFSSSPNTRCREILRCTDPTSSVKRLGSPVSPSLATEVIYLASPSSPDLEELSEGSRRRDMRGTVEKLYQLYHPLSWASIECRIPAMVHIELSCPFFSSSLTEAITVQGLPSSMRPPLPGKVAVRCSSIAVKVGRRPVIFVVVLQKQARRALWARRSERGRREMCSRKR